MQYRFQQEAAVGLGGGELGFELVAQGHQVVYSGDDAVLFGEGGGESSLP
jgi:serine kinase of HPr protein (carbohydrate metabolism regulator)